MILENKMTTADSFINILNNKSNVQEIFEVAKTFIKEKEDKEKLINVILQQYFGNDGIEENIIQLCEDFYGEDILLNKKYSKKIFKMIDVGCKNKKEDKYILSVLNKITQNHIDYYEQNNREMFFSYPNIFEFAVTLNKKLKLNPFLTNHENLPFVLCLNNYKSILKIMLNAKPEELQKEYGDRGYNFAELIATKCLSVSHLIQDIRFHLELHKFIESNNLKRIQARFPSSIRQIKGSRNFIRYLEKDILPNWEDIENEGNKNLLSEWLSDNSKDYGNNKIKNIQVSSLMKLIKNKPHLLDQDENTVERMINISLKRTVETLVEIKRTDLLKNIKNVLNKNLSNNSDLDLLENSEIEKILPISFWISDNPNESVWFEEKLPVIEPYNLTTKDNIKLLGIFLSKYDLKDKIDNDIKNLLILKYITSGSFYQLHEKEQKDIFRKILNGDNIDENFVMFINKPSNRDFKMVEKYQNESEKYEEFLSVIEKNILSKNMIHNNRNVKHRL
jgi:hypothetical protein